MRNLFRSLTGIGLLTATLHGAPIAINNPGFEIPALAAGGWGNDIVDWEGRDGAGSGNSFIENITGFSAEGGNHVGMATGYYLFQDTGVAWEANTKYTLEVAAGNRNANFSPPSNSTFYGLMAGTADLNPGISPTTADLLNSAQLVASAQWNATETVAVGSFGEAPKLEFTTTDAIPAGNIVIVLGDNSAGGRSHFDDIRLDAEAALDGDGDGLPTAWENDNGLDDSDDGSTNVDNGADGDPDNDNRTNLEEFQAGTNPNNDDTDADGLKDDEEADRGTNPLDDDSDDDGLLDGVEDGGGVWISASMTGTNPLAGDTDGDGLQDNVEDNGGVWVDANQTGTDPNNEDTDGDTLIDGWESSFSLDPNDDGTTDPANGADGDSDNDSSSNSEEQAKGTDPGDDDSDDDTVIDGYEDGGGVWVSATQTGSDPLDPDTDDDSLGDGVETGDGNYIDANATGTDPNKHDSDDDGYFDEQEIAQGTNPSDAESKPAFPTPLGYWAFDDQGADTTADLSPNGNDGSVIGGATYVAGHTGAPGDFAINFDGIDDAVTTTMSLSGIGEFTMAGWIRFPIDQTNRSGLFGQNDILEFGFSVPSNVHLWSNPGGAINATLAPSEEWVHIAFVGDSTGRTIFFNGEPAITGPAATPLNASAFFFNIGGGGVFDATGNFFEGEIDDVGVWEVSMSPALIKGLADGTISPVPGLNRGELAITGFALDGGQVSLTVGGTIPGVDYIVEESANLGEPWSELTDFVGADGVNETELNTFLSNPNAPKNFLRVRILEE